MPAPRVIDWTESQLAMLRPLYPAWDLWAVRHATQRQTAWCARPKGTPTATINVWSPEALISAIREQEQEQAGE